MVRRLTSVVLGLAAAFAATAVHADGAPTYVVPGKRSVAVMINNYDATWAVVEGDRGLDRPGHMVPTVIGGRYMGRAPELARRNPYYPSTGQAPPQGRLEIEPPADRQLPPPAESFSQSWSTYSEQAPVAELPVSAPGPASIPGVGTESTPFNPPVIVVPQFGPGRRSH